MQRIIASFACVGILAAWTIAGGTKGGTIEGTWIATASIVGGKKGSEKNLKKKMLTVVFKSGDYVLTVAGKRDEAGTYKTDAAKKPATIDLKITAGENKGRTELGIYKIEGDTMTIAVAPHDGRERPKDFEPAAKSEIMVFKRHK